ncbi:MAG: phosphatidylserine decarboxylase, partial [Myxococcota bacterium]|nr:phosphatidylserine decarboxylase [Myxococcota bacterium]
MATHAMLDVLSKPAFSRFIGRIAQAEVPSWLLRAVIDRYVAIYDVDLTDMRDPIDSFTSFDDFFGRRLTPGARPIDDRTNVVVSPVDGKILNFGRVSD